MFKLIRGANLSEGSIEVINLGRSNNLRIERVEKEKFSPHNREIGTIDKE